MNKRMLLVRIGDHEVPYSGLDGRLSGSIDAYPTPEAMWHTLFLFAAKRYGCRRTLRSVRKVRSAEWSCRPFGLKDTGISGLWVLRTLSFIFGLPGTIVTFFAVCEGSEHAYGVDLPERELPESRQIANWVELTLQES
jgi:hypothetical protein